MQVLLGWTEVGHDGSSGEAIEFTIASEWKLQEQLCSHSHRLLSKLLTVGALASFSLVFPRNSLCRVNSGSYADLGISLQIVPGLALYSHVYCWPELKGRAEFPRGRKICLLGVHSGFPCAFLQFSPYSLQDGWVSSCFTAQTETWVVSLIGLGVARGTSSTGWAQPFGGGFTAWAVCKWDKQTLQVAVMKFEMKSVPPTRSPKGQRSAYGTLSFES